MESPEPRKPHWSEIDLTQPRSGSLSPAAPQKHPNGRKGMRLALICVTGLIAIGVLSFLALDHVGAFSRDKVSQDLPRLTGQVATETNGQGTAEAEAALRERVLAWNALLESIAATGADKTAELATFLSGPPDEVSQMAADYQARWSTTEGEDGAASVVPNSMAIDRIILGPNQTLATVIIAQEVQTAGDPPCRCIEVTTWMPREGLWCRTTQTRPYCTAGNDKRSIDQSVQVDGLVWAMERIQDHSAMTPSDTSNSYVTLTFQVRNQDLSARWVDDYVLRLWGPEGWSAEASAATPYVLPNAIQQLHYSLAVGERRSFTVAYEVEAGVDLAQLEFEVVPIPGAAPPSSPPSTPNTTARPDLLNQQAVEPGTPHAWALAASALLCHLNGGRDDLLGTHVATAQNMRMEKQALADWWGVNSKEDLLASLDWIDRGGHRQSWDDIASYLALLSEDELQAVLVEVAKDYETKHQVDMVMEHATALGRKSLLGWDYSRYIYLCRCGYACGYLTDKEAWDLIMPVATMLQKTFGSWEELGQNYLIGREFWSYEQMERDGHTIRRAYETLVSSPSSPWKLNPWDMDLGLIPDLTV